MTEPDYFFGLSSPLEAIPAAGQTRAAVLRGFAGHVRARGGAPERILARYGLDSAMLEDMDGHIPCGQLAAMLEYCSQLFDDPLFGLHLGMEQTADVFGCVTALCRAAPDVRTALHCMVRYIPVAHSPDALPALIEGGANSELRWAVHTDVGYHEQANLQALMLQMKLLQDIAGDHFRPLWVGLTARPRPQDLAGIAAVISAPVQAGADINTIGFVSTWLDQRLITADRLIYRLLGGYLGRLRIINRQDLAEQVRSYVRGALPTGHCSVERCAARLGRSVRALQVHLAGRGLSFSALVEEQREQLARIYLLQTHMPMAEAAERLGYAEQTSFGRAFHRWTGLTPGQFRRRMGV